MGSSAEAPPAVLTTRRLLLNPVSPEDERELVGLFHEPAVRRYLLDDMVVDAAWVAAEVEASAGRFRDGSAGLWAVRERGSSERIVGFAGFRPFFDPPELQLLYGLHPDVQGQGYATEAAGAVLDHGFNALGFSTATAATDIPNRASVAVMERLGMAQDRVTDDGPEGTVFYRLDRPGTDPASPSADEGTTPAPPVQDAPSVQDRGAPGL